MNDEEALKAQLAQQAQLIAKLSRSLAAYQNEYNYLKPYLHWIHIGIRLIWLTIPKLGKLTHYPPRPIEYPEPFKRPHDSAWPKIAIVTPSFQQAEYLSRTLSSVLEQHYPNLEYFVQDGGSTDGSVAILQQFSSQLSGWESAADLGQAQAINLGFRRTDGEIMAWLNSDDLLMPGSLALVADYFSHHPDVDVIYGHRILINEDDQEIGRWILPEHDDKVLSWADFVPQESLFWRRSLWERCGGAVDESFRFAMDWDLLLRFQDAGAKIRRLPYFMGAFRIHHSQKTIAHMADTGIQEMTRLRQRSLGYAPTRIQIRNAIFPYILKHLLSDLQWRWQRWQANRHKRRGKSTQTRS